MIRIGKIATMMVTMYLGSIPNPKATTRAGAIAMTGVTMMTITTGMRARSRILNSHIRTASR
ncbi:hypothetical protein D9M69_728110 [compost metagenome]